MTLGMLLYPSIGLCGGFLAGLLGIGGGLIFVPALLWVLPYQGMAASSVAHAAVATSLATVIVTSVIASYSHHRRGAVEWGLFARMAPGLGAGAMIGAILATGLSGDVIKTCFGIFALVVALQMGLGLQVMRRGQLPATLGLVTAGAVIGAISAVVGIGGGTITVPFLRWGRVMMQRSVATSSACAFPIAMGGSLGFSLMSLAGDLPSTAVGIYWPAAVTIALFSAAAAPHGARLAHRVSTKLLTRIFAVLLAGIGLRLIMS